VTSEPQFIAMMRSIATSPAANGLQDDVALIEIGSETLVITHDMMVEGVHWLPGANPADVAWKLLAVNLSDLAAKGAHPIGVLLGFMLGSDDWDIGFAAGLHAALNHYNVALLGGDTVSEVAGPRSLGMTAIGRATHIPAPSRTAAKEGDWLYVTGTLGDAKVGFEMENGHSGGDQSLRDAFNRPKALLDEGRALAPLVHAMMDISDGLFIDAGRMASASGLGVTIDIANIPLSRGYINFCGDTSGSRLEAGSWGDDYQLLFACSNAESLPVAATRVGTFLRGTGLTLIDNGSAIESPMVLGFEHR
jgi:thiamine-monophosphate kinase